MVCRYCCCETAAALTVHAPFIIYVHAVLVLASYSFFNSFIDIVCDQYELLLARYSMELKLFHPRLGHVHVLLRVLGVRKRYHRCKNGTHAHGVVWLTTAVRSTVLSAFRKGRVKLGGMQNNLSWKSRAQRKCRRCCCRGKDGREEQLH